jgi:hypothetical protein
MKVLSIFLTAAATPFLVAALLPHSPSAAGSEARFDGRVLAPCPDPTMDPAAWALLEAQLPEEDCLYAIEPAGGTLVIIRELFRVPHLDIKPGSCPNPVNVSNGGSETDDGDGAWLARVPISILGNGFDVTQTDVTTVTLSRFEPLMSGSGLVRPVQATFADTGTPFLGSVCDCHTLQGDGFLDLDLKFDRTEMVEELDLDLEPDDATVRLRVAGRIAAGVGFRITDCIRIINHGQGSARAER